MEQVIGNDVVKVDVVGTMKPMKNSSGNVYFGMMLDRYGFVWNITIGIDVNGSQYMVMESIIISDNGPTTGNPISIERVYSRDGTEIIQAESSMDLLNTDWSASKVYDITSEGDRTSDSGEYIIRVTGQNGYLLSGICYFDDVQYDFVGYITYWYSPSFVMLIDCSELRGIGLGWVDSDYNMHMIMYYYGSDGVNHTSYILLSQ